MGEEEWVGVPLPKFTTGNSIPRDIHRGLCLPSSTSRAFINLSPSLLLLEANPEALDPQLVQEQASPPLAFSMAAEPLTELEAAIETVVKIFFTFAGREGKKGSLSVNEFKELATQQLPHLLKDVGSLDEKMKSLDVNQDSELKFNEYWRLIGELAREMKKEKASVFRKK